MESKLIETELRIINRKKISIAEVSYAENDVVVFDFFDDITIGISEIKELAFASNELTGGVVPTLNLVITGQRNNISTEAFAYNVFEELKITQITIAEALVIQNLATRIMANFYYKVVPRKFPVKVFENKEQAIEWLFESKNALN